MRLIVYYIIPAIAVFLAIILVLTRNRPTKAANDNGPAVSTPLAAIILGISGAVGVIAIIYIFEVLGYL